MRRRLIVNCAALSRAMLADPTVTPHLSRLAAGGQLLDLEPSFPALTCAVQASLTTGRPPSDHGIVANGFYQADLAEVRFWEQSAHLVQAPPAWSWAAKRRRVAMLFWQNSMYADVDIMMTPRPMHTEGGLVADCYSKPAGLYRELAGRLGEFPLINYWGPLAGLGSSQWIAAATEAVWREQQPDLCLTYLPHLDYNTQRRGPDPGGLADDLRQLDELVGRLAAMAEADGADCLILSEYSLSPVTRAVALNRVLRQAGLLALREVGGLEYLDCGACRAFAMADHQVAHVYFPALTGTQGPDALDGVAGLERRRVVAEVRELLASTEGVAEVLDLEAQKDFDLRHPRGGDLVCVAEPESWFSYYWWLDEARAPDFARTVDIHRKPGYDPVELFFDPATRSIPLRAELVRGSHGRTGRGDPRGVFLTAQPMAALKGLTVVRATDVAKLAFGL